jgi:hypothetical protein
MGHNSLALVSYLSYVKGFSKNEKKVIRKQEGVHIMTHVRYSPTTWLKCDPVIALVQKTSALEDGFFSCKVEACVTIKEESLQVFRGSNNSRELFFLQRETNS